MTDEQFDKLMAAVVAVSRHTALRADDPRQHKRRERARQMVRAARSAIVL